MARKKTIVNVSDRCRNVDSYHEGHARAVAKQKAKQQVAKLEKHGIHLDTPFQVPALTDSDRQKLAEQREKRQANLKKHPELTPWQPGQSGDKGRRIPLEVKILARTYTEEAIHTLAEICSDKRAGPSSRVQAATTLLDRGWGKATQYVEAKIGPLDKLSIDDQRTLFTALSALSGSEEDAEGRVEPTAH